MKPKSLKNTLKTAFISFSVAPLILMGVILVRESYLVQKEQALKLQRETSERVTFQISSYLYSIESELRHAITIIDIPGLDDSKIAEALSKIRSYHDVTHGKVYSEIDLIDSKGMELARTSRVDVFTKADLRNRSGDEEFALPAATGEVYYSPVSFAPATGEPSITMSLPIRDMKSGLAKGVLVAEIRLKDIWKLISTVHIGESGKVYLLDQRGRIIAHENPSVVLKGTRAGHLQKEGITRGLEGAFSLVTSRTVPLGNRLVYVVTEWPISEAFALTYWIVIVAAVFVIVAIGGVIGLGLLVRRRIIRPLESLTEAANSIEAGELILKAPMSGNFEIDLLADAFNNMADKLIGTIGTLKWHIAERNAAQDMLEEMNLQLRREIADRLKMEEELLNAKKLESVAILAAGVAHEINNPLTNAFMNTRALKTRLLGMQQNKYLLEKIGALERNIEKVSTIARELLQFSRHGKIEFQPVELNEIIKGSLILLDHRLNEITVHCDFAGLPPVLGDPLRMEQLFLNILSNSIDAMPDGGDIYIATSKDGGGSAVVAITDTGSGIPEKNISRIFDPFFTTKEIGMGTGLGLSICYGIIKEHKGSIEVSSVVGKGTTITLKVPSIPASSGP